MHCILSKLYAREKNAWLTFKISETFQSVFIQFEQIVYEICLFNCSEEFIVLNS